MTEQIESIKNFAVAFFTNLKAELVWQNDVLIVNKVPQDFETSFGKKAPYYLIFDREKENAQTELLAKGSSLLKVMTSYLDQRGQATLLKMVFDLDLKSIVSQQFSLKNAEISSLTRQGVNHPLVRFTFATTFQYLNEKEQVMTSLCIDNNALLTIDLDTYTLTEGKKEELSLENLDSFYTFAKSALKQLLETKTKEISTMLATKLEKERARIAEHYQHQLSELDLQKTRLQNQILEFERLLSKAAPTELLTFNAKIKRAQENLLALKYDEKKAQLQKEESFFLNDERHKHSLGISNKILNTTILYYPIYTLTIFLKNQETGRLLELVYNPLKKELSPLSCESCKTALKDIVLCGGSHLVCPTCTSACGNCNKYFCATCLARQCESCGRHACKKCLVKCFTCGKYKCRTHIKKDSITRQESCLTCLRQCPVCYEYTSPSHIKRAPAGNMDMCERCLRKEIGKRTISNVFGS